MNEMSMSMKDRMKEMQRNILSGDVEKQFVFTEVRHETGSFMGEYEISKDKHDVVFKYLDCDLEELNVGEAYLVSADEVAALCKELEIFPENHTSSGCLSVETYWSPPSYVIHTNRELDLMIAGRKPMAVFDYDAAEYIEESFSNQKFSNYYVSHNIKRIVIEGYKGRPRYFFVLPGEEWRAPAYSLLAESMSLMGFSPQFEWLEGKLLGYSDEENKVFLSGMFDFDKRREIRD